MPETCTGTGPRYVYAMTKTGEAQHAAEYDGRAATRTVCGRKVASAYGPAFVGEQGIQHPWRCTKCHDSIQERAAEVGATPRYVYVHGKGRQYLCAHGRFSEDCAECEARMP